MKYNELTNYFILWFTSKDLELIKIDFFQAVINSTITPNMTFTKTSQKFGQWSDTKANTVYGLGFASESELTKVFDAWYFIWYYQ